MRPNVMLFVIVLCVAFAFEGSTGFTLPPTVLMRGLYGRSQSSDDNDDDTTEQKQQSSSSSNRPLPKLIIFDLDGCLWRPEMYELLYFSGGAGAPFTKSPEYDTDGTLLTTKGEPVRLLAQVREILQEIYCDRNTWKNTQIGISSRTDQPDWARELLQKFTIQVIPTYDTTTTTTTTEASLIEAGGGSSSSSSSSNDGGYFCLEDVFQGPIEIESDSKVKHFERISKKASVPMEEILFFDNERGNCVEVAKLGVVVAWVPDGVTKLMWDIALNTFPTSSGKVIGLDVFGYDTLDGANLFYGDGYKRTEW